MLISSHKIIGNIVCDVIEEKLNIKLDREGVLYGCELPDISPNFMLILHFKKYSFNFVLKLINRLISQGLPQEKSNLKIFSVNLGIILHYLADYFCYAHNRKKYNFLPLHLAYEYMLDNRFFKFEFKDIIDTTSNLNVWQNLHSLGQIEEYINYKIDEYNYLDHKIENDVIYSIETCLIISHAIISHCNSYKFSCSA
ncbi:hypothetical protein Q428_12650 [Fervidicella metallireducens AeB]|uniref:Phospholipase C/D domain-containing protein n=2 Tax=Fervidicella TaxID=1403538 RepID=A0A017RUL6_9CLOT|nr:hypothetical protein Q428_12650 [Fervidicella metallireducens AeB]